MGHIYKTGYEILDNGDLRTWDLNPVPNNSTTYPAGV